MIINHGRVAINLPSIDVPNLPSPFYKWVQIGGAYSDLANSSCRVLVVKNKFITIYSRGKIIRIKNWQTESPIFETLGTLFTTSLVLSPSVDYYRSDSHYNAFCAGDLTSGAYTLCNFKVSLKDGSYSVIATKEFSIASRGLAYIAHDKNDNWFIYNEYGSQPYMVHKITTAGAITSVYSATGATTGSGRANAGCTTSDGYALFLGRTYGDYRSAVIYEKNDGTFDVLKGAADSGNLSGGGMGRIDANTYWHGHMGKLTVIRNSDGTIFTNYTVASTPYKDAVAKYGDKVAFQKNYSGAVSGDTAYQFYYKNGAGADSTLAIPPPSGLTITNTYVNHDEFAVDEFGYAVMSIAGSSATSGIIVINHKELTES